MYICRIHSILYIRVQHMCVCRVLMYFQMTHFFFSFYLCVSLTAMCISPVNRFFSSENSLACIHSQFTKTLYQKKHVSALCSSGIIQYKIYFLAFLVLSKKRTFRVCITTLKDFENPRHQLNTREFLEYFQKKKILPCVVCELRNNNEKKNIQKEPIAITCDVLFVRQKKLLSIVNQQQSTHRDYCVNGLKRRRKK